MDKKDFSDLEDQIRDTVKSAFNAIDFARLKKDVSGKTESALNEVKMNLKNKSNYFNEKMENKKQNLYRKVTNATQIDEKRIQMYICKKPVGRISGILYTIFGSVLSGLTGIMLIIYSIFSSLLGVISTSNFIGLGILFSFFMASMALTLRGINLRKRVKRFKQYVSFLNGHSYCSIEELASLIKKKNKFVVKDLMKMIGLGMFKEAHIDNKQTYFMINNEVYENYLNLQKDFKQRNEDELKREEGINDIGKKELRYMIEMGKDYIEEIKNANNAINAEGISNKLYRLENIVRQILNYIEKNPKKLPEVSKFNNHYLPITLKLVNAYKDLNDQSVQGDNIKSAKNEIERTMDVINLAFETLLDDLFGEIALDISTDISVLETLFTQEGLTKNDFKK